MPVSRYLRGFCFRFRWKFRWNNRYGSPSASRCRLGLLSSLFFSVLHALPVFHFSNGKRRDPGRSGVGRASRQTPGSALGTHSNTPARRALRFMFHYRDAASELPSARRGNSVRTYAPRKAYSASRRGVPPPPKVGISNVMFDKTLQISETAACAFGNRK